jgi:mRNA-degrading endonuclease toxin of MazEF toxin-antitoxin module
MSTTDDTTTTELLFVREHKKRALSIKFSPELRAVLDQKQPDGMTTSRQIERLLWERLVHKHGRADVEAMIAAVDAETERTNRPESIIVDTPHPKLDQ